MEVGHRQTEFLGRIEATARSHHIDCGTEHAQQSKKNNAARRKERRLKRRTQHWDMSEETPIDRCSNECEPRPNEECTNKKKNKKKSQLNQCINNGEKWGDWLLLINATIVGRIWWSKNCHKTKQRSAWNRKREFWKNNGRNDKHNKQRVLVFTNEMPTTKRNRHRANKKRER